MQFELGAILEGKVAKITNYGAFIDFPEGGSGMVHISEVSNTYVKDINDHIKLGDTVKVKVIGINEQHKVSLSIKALEEKKKEAHGERAPRQRSFAPRSFNKPAEIPSTGDPFEDMMNKFKKSSDDKLSDLKRSMDTKRGTGRRPRTK